MPESPQPTLATVPKKGKTPTPPHVRFLDITESFFTDLDCIKEMFVTVIPVLQKQDKERESRIDKIFKIEKLKDADGNMSASISVDDAKRFIYELRRLRRAELLFRREAIVSMVSRFDEYFAAVLTQVFKLHPEWLKTNSKTITYKEIIELKTVENAVANLVEREVEDLMRGSKFEQIEYLDEKQKLGFREGFNLLPDFLEVTERRNLFAHTGGRISKQYLEKCGKYKVKLDGNVKIGSRVEITDSYFTKAFRCFFEAALRISQASYRRLFPEFLEACDKSINHLAIRLLEEEEWELAECVSNFFLEVPEALRSADAEFYYYAVINRAIAQKFAGKDIEAGLKGPPWNSLHSKYVLALHVLKGEFKEAAVLTSNQAVIETIEESGFRTWPLFREYRETPEFADAYVKAFGHSYKISKEDVAEELAPASEVEAPASEVEAPASEVEAPASEVTK